MKTYQLEEFNPGEFVYHKTNIKQPMLVIQANLTTNKVDVSYIHEGITNRESFYSFELVKREDLPSTNRRATLL